jgi:hypothetical protein
VGHLYVNIISTMLGMVVWTPFWRSASMADTMHFSAHTHTQHRKSVASLKCINTTPYMGSIVPLLVVNLF